MKKYLLKSRANHIQQFPVIVNLITKVTDGLTCPIEATDIGEIGDMETPIVALPNGKLTNVFFFEYEEM